MKEEFAKSIDERAHVAFKKVKDDVLFLNNRIEILDKNLQKHSKNSEIHYDSKVLGILEDLVKRIEKLENRETSIEQIMVEPVNKSKVEMDDLTKVEGIGPVISKLLIKNEIFSFKDLSKTSIKKLKEILEKNNLQSHNPTTWPKQAKLAQEGKWEQLKKWQNELMGGRL